MRSSVVAMVAGLVSLLGPARAWSLTITRIADSRYVVAGVAHCTMSIQDCTYSSQSEYAFGFLPFDKTVTPPDDPGALVASQQSTISVNGMHAVGSLDLSLHDFMGGLYWNGGNLAQSVFGVEFSLDQPSIATLSGHIAFALQSGDPIIGDATVRFGFETAAGVELVNHTIASSRAVLTDSADILFSGLLPAGEYILSVRADGEQNNVLPDFGMASYSLDLALSPVPEPSIFWLALASVAAMAARARAGRGPSRSDRASR